MLNLNAIIAALAGKQWVLAGAFVVGGVVALMKQGYLSTWLAKKLSSVALPYLAVVLGALGMSAAEVAAGKPLGQAIIDGIQSGVLAVFGHETLVEGMRGGREIVPEKSQPLPFPPKTPEAS